MLKLIIEDDEGRKTVVPFMRDEITIGRQEGNTIRLTERNVSRRHARLVRQNGHVLVEDLGSYNGVRINGERIQGQTQVADGDLIQIGDYDLALQKEAAAQAQPPAPPPSQVGAPTIRMPSSALHAALDEAQHRAQTELDVPAHQEEEEQEEEEEEEDDAPTPPSADQRRNSTAVIRMDQVEMNRPRKVAAVEADEAPHLLVVSAELKGQEFACIRTEMRIGRTDENDITIDHRSLSRTHAKLVREDTGEWRIIDMQSANGMAVNGESYAQAPLAHGDLIELGHVKLRFIGPGQSAEGLTHEGTAGQGSKKGLVLALVGVLLLGAVGGGLWFVFGQQPSTTVPPPPPAVVDTRPTEPKQPATPQPQNPAPQPTEPTAPDFTEQLKSARASIDARDFDTAVKTLESIQDTDGQRPTEAQELLNQAKAEQESKQNLDRAQKAFDEGRHQEAMPFLEAAEGTLAFAEEHAALKEKVDAAIEAAKAGTNGKTPVPVAGTKTPPRPTPQGPTTEQQAKQLFDDGYMLLRKAQLPEAESVLRKCIGVDPTYAQCYLALGTVMARRNRPDEGAQYYREFLRLAPNHEMAPNVRKLVADYDKSQKQPGGGK